jgi:hypothetical protein
MKKSEMVRLGRILSKEYFSTCLDERHMEYEIEYESILIMGLKEFDDEVRMLFRLPILNDILCEIVIDKNNLRIKESSILKKINL